MGGADAIAAILTADTAFMALVPGGVVTAPLNPDDPEQAAVWAVNPTTRVKRLVGATAVLLAPQEVDSPIGLNPGRRLDTDLWPELYLYADRVAFGGAIDEADARAMALLHERAIGTDLITATGYRARPLPADELPGDVWQTFRRYRVERSRHIAEVT